jgi:hypothetical protein
MTLFDADHSGNICRTLGLSTAGRQRLRPNYVSQNFDPTALFCITYAIRVRCYYIAHVWIIRLVVHEGGGMRFLAIVSLALGCMLGVIVLPVQAQEKRFTLVIGETRAISQRWEGSTIPTTISAL